MPRLVLRLFGLPRVELEGRPVVTDRRKALALFIYLAVTGQEYTREALATLLWPDHDTAHALAYLRRTFWEINQTFGPEWMEITRETARISTQARESLWLDVNRFRMLLAQSRACHPSPEIIPLLEEAVGLYQDDFLAGFYLKDTILYEEWVSTQAETLRREYLFALETLALAHARRGETQPAIELARLWVSRDSFNEAAQGLLIDLYASSGRPGQALKQYQHYAEMLLREMGMEPSAEMKHRMERIKNQSDWLVASPAEQKNKPSLRFVPPSSSFATSFFGRRAELQELEKLLRDPHTRLISILGPGGVGKTRLALEAGRIYAALFADGVCFVPLASVSNPEYVISTIAEGLGNEFTAQQIRSPQEQLIDFLAPLHLLLILDNLEHLQATWPALPEFLEMLLESAPRLKILITSHERLNLHQEWVLSLRGMPVPDSSPGSWEQSAAVQLFLQNVRKAAASLRLDEADRQAITHICQLVGGLPLGLELAAAWSRALSCREIAIEIERSLDFLRTPLRNVAQRHQSLRATFEYSWNLLKETEQNNLMQLAVFRGGFGRDAVQAILGCGLADLIELADKSFIWRDETGRFDIHQALKPFVSEKLTDHPVLYADTLSRYTAYFAEFANLRRLALRGHAQRIALNELTIELDNLLTAWNWALTQGRENEVLLFYESLFRYFDWRNRFQDAEALFARALELWQNSAGQENVVFGVLLACQAWFCNRLSRITQAHYLLLRSLELLRRLQAGPHLMFVNSLALYVMPLTGDMAEIEQIAQETLAYYQAQNDPWGVAQILPFFHRVKTPKSLQEAIRLHHQTLEIYRETGDAAGLAATMTSLGELLHYTGDYESALRFHQSSLDLARELDDRRMIAASLDYLGFIYRQIGRFDMAREHHQQSMTISRELGNMLGIAGAFDNLGLLSLDTGDANQALDLFEQALSMRRQAGQLGAVAISLEHIATAALLLKDENRAEEALTEALTIFEREPEWVLTSRARIRWGDLLRARGDLVAAEQHYLAALTFAREHESIVVWLDACLSLAELLAAQRNFLQAAQWAGTVASHRASEFTLRQRAQQLLDGLRSFVSEDD